MIVTLHVGVVPLAAVVARARSIPGSRRLGAGQTRNGEVTIAIHRVDTGINSVHGDEIIPFGFSVGIHRTGHKQLVADESRILPRGNHRPDNAGENH